MYIWLFVAKKISSNVFLKELLIYAEYQTLVHNNWLQNNYLGLSVKWI